MHVTPSTSAASSSDGDERLGLYIGDKGLSTYTHVREVGIEVRITTHGWWWSVIARRHVAFRTFRRILQLLQQYAVI